MGRGGALGIHQGGVTHVAALWCCMWRRGPRGNNITCSAFCQLLVTSATNHKQIGPFWFPGGCVCVHSRTLWVSPVNSLVRLPVFSCHCNPYRFFQSMVLRLYFPALEPWVAQSVSLPSHPLHQLPPHLPLFSSCCLAVSPLCPAAHPCPSYWSG